MAFKDHRQVVYLSPTDRYILELTSINSWMKDPLSVKIEPDHEPELDTVEAEVVSTHDTVYDYDNGISDDAEFDNVTRICDELREENSMFIDDTVCDKCGEESRDYETSVSDVEDGFESVPNETEVDMQDAIDGIGQLLLIDDMSLMNLVEIVGNDEQLLESLEIDHFVSKVNEPMFTLSNVGFDVMWNEMMEELYLCKRKFPD